MLVIPFPYDFYSLSRMYFYCSTALFYTIGQGFSFIILVRSKFFAKCSRIFHIIKFLRNQIKQFTNFFRVKNILNSEGNETFQTENFDDKFECTQKSAIVKENVQAQANAISFTKLTKNLTIPGKIARQPF